MVQNVAPAGARMAAKRGFCMRCTDIAIIGGGLAGSTAAAMLGRAGISTILVDPHPIYPCDFRVEKLSGNDQLARLFKTGIAESVLRSTTHEGENWIARFGYLLDRKPRRPATPGRRRKPIASVPSRSTEGFTGACRAGRGSSRGSAKVFGAACTRTSARRQSSPLTPPRRPHPHRRLHCRHRPDRPRHASCGPDRPRACDRCRCAQAVRRVSRARSPGRSKSR
jgi:hypothetical protein